jgi:hypothetical protein
MHFFRAIAENHPAEGGSAHFDRARASHPISLLRPGPQPVSGRAARDRFRVPASVLLAVCGLLLSTGCQTTSPTGDSVMVFETIQGRSLSSIRLAALEVFQAGGYQVKSAFHRDLVFEQQGSTMSSIAFGSWAEPAIWLRVKLRIEELRPGVNALQCNVYRVQNRGDTILEEESRAYGKKKKPFQEMLRTIKAKLDALPPDAEFSPTPPAKGDAPK